MPRASSRAVRGEGRRVLPPRLGRYDILGELAVGGMAAVHLGRITGTAGFARVAAIKVLHPHLSHDPEFVAMFLDEARLAARIRHGNVVDVFDVAALDGELLIVMEYVEGAALSTILREAQSQKRKLPLGFCLGVAHQALLGLHAAHELTDDRGQPLGLIHRDVSPQNLLVDVEGVTRVTDFGVAKAAGRLRSTAAGAVKGKLHYLAPEQLSRRPTDRRVDVFAAGIVLWEMLTGRHLFRGESEAETMSMILSEPIVPPSTLRSDVPIELDEISMRALERNPDRRHRTAAELAEELENVMGSHFSRARAIGEVVRELGAETISRARKLIERGPGTPLPRPSAPRSPLSPHSPSGERGGYGAASSSPAEADTVAATTVDASPTREQTERLLDGAAEPSPSSGAPAPEVETVLLETRTVRLARVWTSRPVLLGMAGCALVGGALAWWLLGDRGEPESEMQVPEPPTAASTAPEPTAPEPAPTAQLARPSVAASATDARSSAPVRPKGGGRAPSPPRHVPTAAPSVRPPGPFVPSEM